ncbi:hypothetical protein [Marinilabilia rubra]|uniref:Uncharacterized protein n=1 Tax=Marinilabilia rubra TaxID=2162893 RepID=A0A2U2BAF8_9BACT|nr:hypothetical protein [Marinilabilia rubra]PWE00050.1 hypothetical protein DDZ16_06725 [Marinilabilia rubra]
MENSDSQNRFRKILEGFKEADDFNASFKEFFIDRLCRIIEDRYPTLEFSEKMAEHLVLYAENTISYTESVIDKDASFPDFRKKEEVIRMKSVVKKLPDFCEDTEFVDRINSEAKMCMVKFFPEIYDLSGDGFRLLDVNARFFNHGFLSNLSETRETVR